MSNITNEKELPMFLIIETLEEKLKNNQVDIKEFKKVWYILSDAKIKLQELAEYAMLQADDKSEWQNFLKEIKGANMSDLMDRLRKLGYAIRAKSQNEELIKAFKSSAFRILEQTRAGKKDDVFYSMLRIFVVNGKSIPSELVTAFRYQGEFFKVLVFSFLSGILGEEDLE